MNTAGPMLIARGIQYHHPGQIIALKDARRAKATPSKYGVAWSLYRATLQSYFSQGLRLMEQRDAFKPCTEHFAMYRVIRNSGSRVLVMHIFSPRLTPPGLTSAA